MVEPLKTRLALAGVAGCTCQTKTPELSFHLPICRFRLMWESMTRIDELEAALRFYRDGFVMNGMGDIEEAHLTQWWMEPSELLLADEGRTAHDALAAPPIDFTGRTCTECGPVPPVEVTQEERHDPNYGGCGREVS